MIAFCPHPYRVRSENDGFSHGLKKCPPDTFLPRLRRGRPFESHHCTHMENATRKGGIFYVYDLDTIDVSTISPYCDQYSLMPTPVPGAFIRLWILPRPKNSPPDCFYPGCAGAGLSNPITASTWKMPPGRVAFSMWSEWRDSNPRPLGPEPSAIPSFATPR